MTSLYMIIDIVGYPHIQCSVVGVGRTSEDHVVCAIHRLRRTKSIKSSRPAFPTTATMDTAETRLRLQRLLWFRVLVIGRANAGKTSILQRVCETTESPTIYRGNKEVRGPSLCLRLGSYCR